MLWCRSALTGFGRLSTVRVYPSGPLLASQQRQRYQCLLHASQTTLIQPVPALQGGHRPAEAHTPSKPDLPPLVIGIDPDGSGALAAIQVQALPHPDAQEIHNVDVQLHDNPIEIFQGATRKRSAAEPATNCAASRRQADSKAIARIVRGLAAAHSSSTTRILLEIPQPNSLNGKQSWYQTGFSYGVWQGALAAHGFEVETVSCRRWKHDLQLNKKGKEGSRLLAIRLFPTAADLLKRKKDHGRAEAMLIAAWALGLRIEPETESVIVVPAAESSESSEDTEDVMPLEEEVEEEAAC